ncbi:hypothetical protein L5515_006374 [Caenorhabditis briggsae]|uniref:Serpentine receptor class gamma n=1 Tax=Caenorhabditis briggsae TaxID=6238 RepID=A0AAE9F0L1_CAEBR|nr:hypothetical protein L5515_006374 [Caenorhabditis briggsae]
MGMIITSKIKRIYLMFFGFVDVIPNCMSQDNEGFQVSINRFFNAFSFGSVICYLVLFKHLIKENKTVFNVSILRKRTKNRVFYHLLITAVLYLIVNSLHEALIYGFTLFDDTFVKTPFGAVAMIKSINRLFNAFSFGSVICYMILFKHLLQQNKIVFTVSVLRKRAKNRVFYHLLITAILYLTVNALYEALVYGPSLLGDLLGISLVDPVDMMKTLAIANYFPEIYLPLLFILDTVRIWEILKQFLCSKNRTSERGAPSNAGNFT